MRYLLLFICLITTAQAWDFYYPSAVNLTGEVLQEKVTYSTTIDTASSAFPNDSSLTGSITPTYSDSVIKITVYIPRIDVSRISGSFSERTFAVLVKNETDDLIIYEGTTSGRVLIGASNAAATFTNYVNLVNYYEVDSTDERTFRVVYGPGIPTNSQVKLRGDRGALTMILQEMRPQ